ncbi:MAG: hypothetical protein AAFQ98_27020, partial [Bacteroidota bacterium]
MQGVFVVSPNGLGHFKRTLGWLPSLLRAFPDLHLTVAACDWQIERLGTDYLGHSRVRFQPGITDDAVRWSRNAADYEGRDLLAWTHGLGDWEALHAADFVVSDNLVEVLRWRPDALLMGSFLWGDILHTAYPQVAAIEAYRAEEARLLQTYRPPMLCVGDMAMPAVRQQTDAVACPWFA